MQKRFLVLVLMFFAMSSSAWAECGKLCDENWWETATASDVQAELDAGADVNARDESGITPLLYSTINNSTAKVQALLDAGADVNARDENGYTPIIISSSIGSAATVQALLDAGADMNLHAEMGATALMMAMYSNKQETFEVLVQAGATVDVNFRWLGQPLLHLIGRAQHGIDGEDNALWAVRWLIDAGADVNERGAYGYPLLHIACGDGGSAEYCRMIINADNVNVDARNDRGETPLIAAITTEQSESVQLLLDASADVKIKDNSGKDAWDWVKIYPDFKGTDIYWTIAKASGHCGRMCDEGWWSKVKTSDLQKMLDTDAFTKLTDEDQKTAWNLAKSSPLKGSEVYWALHEARFK